MADLTSGVRDLRRIQLGKETYGYAAAVVPTTQLVGMMDAVEERDRTFVDEASGIMSSHRRIYDGAVIAALSFDAGTEGATFEQLINLLAMGVKGDVVPAVVGVDGRRWTYNPDLANGDTPDIFTVRVGDNEYCWQVEGVAAHSLSMGAESRGSWTLTGDLFGDQLAPSAFEDITYPTPLETILGQMTQIYIDDTWAGLGTTPMQGTLIGWSVDIPGFHEKFFQDGQLTFSDYGLASRALTLRVNFEFNDNTVAEWLLWRAGTRRFIRIEGIGSVYEAPLRKTATIDLCAIYESHDALGERDGNDIMSLTARTVWDPTSGREFQFEVINTIVAYP